MRRVRSERRGVLVIDLESLGDITRIHMSSRRSRLVGYSVSAYLAHGVLIDTGFPAVGEELESLLQRIRPRGAIVTHAHEDHAGNLGRLARRGTPVALARATERMVRAEPEMGLYRRFTWSRMSPLREPLEPFADERLELRFMPGHSPDHHIVWEADRGIMYGGDLFLGVKVRAARPGESPRLLARTLRQAARLRPRRLLDAHRGEVRDPVGSLLAKADWLDATIARIDALHALGSSDRAITQEVLGREDAVTLFSAGDLSRLNFVRAVVGEERTEEGGVRTNEE